MIAIVAIRDGEPRGWILASDVPDARRQAQAAFDRPLREFLYRLEFDPRPGKYQIPDSGYWMLVG